jgi:hypothetical protein
MTLFWASVLRLPNIKKQLSHNAPIRFEFVEPQGCHLRSPSEISCLFLQKSRALSKINQLSIKLCPALSILHHFRKHWIYARKSFIGHLQHRAKHTAHEAHVQQPLDRWAHWLHRIALRHWLMLPQIDITRSSHPFFLLRWTPKMTPMTVHPTVGRKKTVVLTDQNWSIRWKRIATVVEHCPNRRVPPVTTQIMRKFSGTIAVGTQTGASWSRTLRLWLRSGRSQWTRAFHKNRSGRGKMVLTNHLLRVTASRLPKGSKIWRGGATQLFRLCVCFVPF